MRLVHTANDERMQKILVKGIEPRAFHKDDPGNYDGITNPNFIYLLAVPEMAEEHVKRNEISFGQYHFFLNMDWVRDNSSQFEERSRNSILEPAGFDDFLREYGIKKGHHGWGDDDTWGGQVISTKSIPLEGIESLFVIRRNISNPNCDLDQLYAGNDTEGHGIYKIVRLRDLIPDKMNLYVGNENSIRRVK